LLIDEVVISASRIEVARKNVPVTVSIINRQQIEMSQESAVLSVLSHRVPGMFVTERGVTGFGIGTGSAGQISMRGVGGTAPNTQVLVLIDGHPQFQGMFAHPFPDAYVSSDVEKVEVIRGPASILYGSNAMAGAINIITKEQKQPGFSGNARVSYGSFNTQKYMASGGFKEGRFSIFASVNHDRTDGHRDTSDFRIVNGYVKAGYELSNHFTIGADFSLADFTSEDPGTIYNPSFFGIDILRGRASFSIKNHFEKTEGGLIAFYNFGNHDFTDGWISEDYHAGISVFQGLSLFRNNQLTVGADLKKMAGIANIGAPGAADVWLDMTDIAAYAFMQQTILNRMILTAGLRMENNSMFGTEIVPQAGLSYFANEKVTLKGSLSKGFRSPTLMELYLFAPNPDLKPERMMNYELGIRRQCSCSRTQFEFTLFLIEGSNVIEVIPNPNPPPPMKRQNVGSFSNKGFEVELEWLASNRLKVSTNYTYLSLDAPRLAAPKHMFFIEGTYTAGAFRTNLSIQRIADLYTQLPSSANNNEGLLESYTLANVMLSYRISKSIELFVSGKNLLDQSYTINYGYPMPGIHFMTGVHARL
jgi:outer membrane cobalamin receptor